MRIVAIGQCVDEFAHYWADTVIADFGPIIGGVSGMFHRAEALETRNTKRELGTLLTT